MIHANQETFEGRPNLNPVHLDSLLKRGIAPATAEAAKLYSATSQQVRALLNFNPTNSPGLAIPYFAPLIGAARMVRIKPDKPPIIDGKEAKYLSPKGAGNLLYFPPNCAERLKNPEEPIVFTEGGNLKLWRHDSVVCFALA